jgi:hypothetical protein
LSPRTTLLVPPLPPLPPFPSPSHLILATPLHSQILMSHPAAHRTWYHPKEINVSIFIYLYLYLYIHSPPRCTASTSHALTVSPTQPTNPSASSPTHLQSNPISFFSSFFFPSRHKPGQDNGSPNHCRRPLPSRAPRPYLLASRHVTTSTPSTLHRPRSPRPTATTPTTSPPP